MKNIRLLSTVIFCALLSACTFTTHPGNGLPPTPDSPTKLPLPVQEELSDCRATVIDCNCRSTFMMAGQVVPTSQCKSGAMRFESCGGYCPGGYGVSWGTQCTCR